MHFTLLTKFSRPLRWLLSSLWLVMLPLLGWGQSFTGTYDFASVTATSGTTDPTTVPTATGVTFGSFAVAGNANTNPNAAGRFSFQGWPGGATDGSNTFTGSLTTNQYYTVTVTPRTGYTLSFSSITFTIQRSGSGVRQYAVRSSIDSYAANLAASISPTNTNLSVVSGNIFQIADVTSAQNGSTITLGTSSFTNVSTPVVFRLYGFNSEDASAGGGTFSIDNVAIK